MPQRLVTYMNPFKRVGSRRTLRGLEETQSQSFCYGKVKTNDFGFQCVPCKYRKTYIFLMLSPYLFFFLKFLSAKTTFV
jgi:hypothetical protein